MLDIKFKYFTWDEILKPLGQQGITKDNIPMQYYQNIVPTIKVLELIREYYGEPIYINSSYRTKEYNEKIGGKKDSLHLVFNAIDWTVKDKKDLVGLYLLLDLWDGTVDKFDFLPKSRGNLGLGKYPTFIHIDTRSVLGRKAPVRWKG
jgi:uncharacterized protein YcbK (DUF882 family)